MVMAIVSLHLQTLLKLLLYCLRIYGLVPVRKTDDGAKWCGLYFVLSVGLQVLVTTKSAVYIAALPKESNKVDDVVNKLWYSSFWLMLIVLRCSLLLLARHFPPIIRYVSRLNRPKTKASLYLILVTILISGIWAFALYFTWYENCTQPLPVAIYNSVVDILLYQSPFFAFLFLKTIMMQIATDLRHCSDELRGMEMNKLLGCETDVSCESSDGKNLTNILASVDQKLKEIRRVVKYVHKIFSIPVSSFLMCEWIELVFIVYTMMYGHTTKYSMPALTVPYVVVHFWFILDSQHQYIKAISHCSYRIKRMASDDRMSYSYRLKLRHLLVEVEQMPKFHVLGLFELGRQCILPMLSVALTYVIVAVQFKQDCA